jgi:hypothetical protein
MIGFVAIQFLEIKKNQSSGEQPNHISTQFAVPEDVENILKTACYDCHSNNTVYPWYANIQPLAWWLQHHVDEGKGELNFDEFAEYKPRRQHHKLEETIEMIKESKMPLSSYTWLHGDAKLSQMQKEILMSWCDGIMQEIKAKNPGSASSEEKQKE